MKNIIYVVFLALGVSNAMAQSQTEEGRWLIEANTNFGNAHASNTGFSLNSTDGETVWNIGAEGGYFIKDNLAIKAGLGYSPALESGSLSPEVFSYKIGAKYYISNVIPVQLDFNGAYIQAADNPSYIGLQAGYAWFLGDNVSVEPGIRYDISTDEEAALSVFQFKIGFAIHI
ncbi:outer membrane beta-barrel protein [Tenacibaculum sp. SG-28]|uniref:outer membrane beta-barrel protein n=1 Tax=Tenacibaculum sp. SG-28 TaxID=754426 RepID=UPI000CF57958|nr:outer membrane beta-barrel protein [Tenacibaculum sp. SG-28]PQJ22761.1 hypothetical protein BSU00_00090 [Tenacibaculum sp. SG-28]